MITTEPDNLMTVTDQTEIDRIDAECRELVSDLHETLARIGCLVWQIHDPVMLEFYVPP